MKRLFWLTFPLLATAACGGGDGNRTAANQVNTTAEEGDINQALSGDELSPIPEAEDDMAANAAGVGNGVGNTAGPQPPVQPLPAPGAPPPPPQGR